jgi:ATP-dependent Zn protease
LRKKGAAVTFVEGTRGGWINFTATFGPIILLVGFWIFMMKVQMQKKKDSNPPGTLAGSGPL